MAVACFVVLVLGVGAALRFGWLSDMEYKGDERWTFDRTQRIPGAEEWPLFGIGLLVDGVVAIVYRHYLLVTFPLEWVSLAYLALTYAPWPRRVLAGLWASQLGMTLLFLAFIHSHGGAPGGDYGVSCRAQSHDSR